MANQPVNEEIQALQSARKRPPMGGGGMPGADPSQENPMVKDKKTGEFFLSRDLFSKMKVREGDKVCVTGTITSTGSTIGFQPESVEDEPDEKPDTDGQDGDDGEAAEKPFDEDLDDTMHGTN